MIKDIVAVGSGGIDIVHLIEDINANKKTYNFLGFLEEDITKIGTEILGYPVLGNDDLLLDELSHCSVINNVMHTTRVHEIITDKIINKYKINDFPNLVHPDVDLRGVKIGSGNIIYRNNSFGPNTRLGSFNIFYFATIGHETTLGDYNLIAKSTIGARCRIGSFNLLGNSTTLSNNVKLGDDNEVGVGSVVMKNYQNGHHLLGYPAIEIDDFIIKYIKK